MSSSTTFPSSSSLLLFLFFIFSSLLGKLSLHITYQFRILICHILSRYHLFKAQLVLTIDVKFSCMKPNYLVKFSIPSLYC
ncbi:hypothetical protein VIGAN_06100800 [Vigna angularis var. angularis]|uniref:Uncharacterized protein n=1 Tax=Vigna angularis var. angularis TaxID=157739 RepID=A0A0S3SAR4_PHAAN|nr:hypothetical protein VIGAN_06100800 [Vigna angularis var. angularis]